MTPPGQVRIEACYHRDRRSPLLLYVSFCQSKYRGVLPVIQAKMVGKMGGKFTDFEYLSLECSYAPTASVGIPNFR